MAINVKVNKDAQGEKLVYPLLMKSGNSNEDDLIVLMTDHKTGIVIKPDSCWAMGHKLRDWVMEKFEPFHGTIELSNK